MTENTDLTNVPQAESEPEKKKGISVVWVIPIVAALVALGIAVQRYLSEGPTIRIVFQNAEGLEAGKTTVKYKDVEIGLVTQVNLTDNHSKILVTAKMEKSAEEVLDADALFWIVKPRITLSGVSGIGTIFSGNYIGFEPGKSREKRRDFVGLESPPPLTRDRAGREFRLRSDTLGSLGIGSPIYYRRLDVGDVIAYDFAKDGKSIDIRIFVNAPYDKFVMPDTRFWEASGLDVSVGSEGISVRTQSVTSLLVGGITFETPTGGPESEASSNTVFTLFKDRKTALAPTEIEVQRYVIRPRESLRGLSVGAPVLFLGLPVGEVNDLRLEYNQKTGELRPRVEISTYMYRFAQHFAKETLLLQKKKTVEQRIAIVDRMVTKTGLRAQLRTGSFVSGQLYVAFDYFPDAPKAMIDWKKDPPEFPMVAGGMTELEEKVRSIVAKIDKLPVEAIGNDVRKALATLDNTLQSTTGTMDSATRALNRVEGETLPEAKKALEDLRRAIATADTLLSNADNTLLGPDAPTQQQMRDAMREIARAAQAVRVLADYLERNPSALIRGKTQENP
jgi:paraquat-inducible protein B